MIIENIKLKKQNKKYKKEQSNKKIAKAYIDDKKSKELKFAQNQIKS